MTAERLEEWLKTAANQAAEQGAIHLDLADSGGPHHLVDGRGADKADFHPLHREFVRHGPQAIDRAAR